MSGAIYLVVSLGLLVSWLMSPVYLVWAVARSVRRHRIPEGAVDGASIEAWRRLSGDDDVTFEAQCGMVIAFPAIALALLAVLGAPAAIGWPILIAVVAIYAVAILAVRGVQLPVWARWWPAIFATAATPLYTAAAWVDGDRWGIALLSSGFGVGYVAAIVVGFRLARAVRRRDDGARALVTSESSFVWPY